MRSHFIHHPACTLMHHDNYNYTIFVCVFQWHANTDCTLLLFLCTHNTHTYLLHWLKYIISLKLMRMSLKCFFVSWNLSFRKTVFFCRNSNVEHRAFLWLLITVSRIVILLSNVTEILEKIFYTIVSKIYTKTLVETM